VALIVFLIVIAVGGLIIGGLARLAVPGPDPMPVWLTMMIGIGGSLIGGIVSRLFLGTAGGVVFAVLGAVLLVILYRRVVQGRGITGPAAREAPTSGVGLRRRREL
jgi:uncharacterized membrane protein YeaQ/YmgE (transglycosylase-associated protein family)